MTPDVPALIAHRGFWWPDRSRQNTLNAIRAAFTAGFGVEVDVRRHLPSDGEGFCLVHDLPAFDTRGLPLWSDFLDLAWAADPTLPILVNVKEARTEAQIAWDLRAHGLTARAWLFDFELCGADPLAAKAAAPEARLLARVCDRPETGLSLEALPTLPHWASGVWLDQWEADWATSEVVAAWHGVGAEVFVVSSELHGRTLDLARTEEWLGADGICTDAPHLVQRVLVGDERLRSANVWWGA